LAEAGKRGEEGDVSTQLGRMTGAMLGSSKQGPRTACLTS
jgi:hypothetical protein